MSRFLTVQRILDAAKTHDENFVDSIEWYNGYADGTEAPNGIAVANWNNPDRYDAGTKTRVKTGDIPERVAKLLEHIGVECDWSDTTSRCEDCGLAIVDPSVAYTQTFYWGGFLPDLPQVCREQPGTIP